MLDLKRRYLIALFVPTMHTMLVRKPNNTYHENDDSGMIQSVLPTFPSWLAYLLTYFSFDLGSKKKKRKEKKGIK